MKKNYLILIICCLYGSLYSQVRNYGFEKSIETYEEISDGTVLATATGNSYGDSFDSVIRNIPAGSIPFDFIFNDIVYTGCNVSSNGFITFGATAPSGTSYTPISSTTSYSGAISAWGADINGSYFSSTTSNISWKVVGNAPNREFVIQYKNVRPFASNNNNNICGINFQIRLIETSNIIKIVYGPSSYFIGTTIYTGNLEIGLRGASNVDFNNRVNNTNISFDNSTLGNSNNSKQNFNTVGEIPGMPSNGLTYTYSPPDPCSGIPDPVTLEQSVVFTCNGSTPTALTGVYLNGSFSGLSHQWESSLDQTTWTNVTVGNFTNPNTFTPPVFNGTEIYYRIKTTCINSNQQNYSNIVTIKSPEAPNSVTGVNFTDINGYSAKINWTNGNGNRRLVLVNTMNSFTIPAVSGAAFTAATIFANTGQQIVYDGTGTSVTISGLSCYTGYFVKVIEYIRCGSSNPYTYYYSQPVSGDFSTIGLFTTNNALPIPQNLNLVGFTGANLSTVSPGWDERKGSVSPNSASASNWTNSSVFGDTSIKINLYGNGNSEWIVSPLMHLNSPSRINLKVAMTDYNLIALDPLGMGATQDDKVQVLITSEDNECATWQVLHTWNAANSGTLTNSFTDFQFVIPSEYIGQDIRIAVKATDGPFDDLADYDIHIKNLSVTEIPACGDIFALVTSAITYNGASLSWDAAVPTPAMGYEIVVRDFITSNVVNTYTSTSNSIVISDLDTTTKYSYTVRAKCDVNIFGIASVSSTFTTLCNYPVLSNIISDEICGTRAANLAATPSFGQVFWYDANNNYLGQGNTIQTPVLSQTTNFYAKAGSVSSNVNVPIGTSNTTSSTYSNPLYSLYSNNHTQHIITAQELLSYGLQAGPIQSLAIDVTGAETLPVIDLSIKIGTTSASSLETFATVLNQVQVYNSASYMPTVGVNTFNFATPFIWDGTSNIIVEFCHGNGNNTATMNRTIKMVTTSYISTVKTHLTSASSSATVCGNTTSNLLNYSVRPLFIFTGEGVCFNPNSVEVIVPVNQAPALVLSNTNLNICVGNSTPLVTITQGASNYDEFTITPTTGVSGNETTGWTFTPSASTVYTITAKQTTLGNCINIVNVDVKVNPYPTIVTTTPIQNTICTSGIQTLSTNTNADLVIGTATTLTTNTDPNTAFNNRFLSNKQQYIYTAQEISQAGGRHGLINSISFNINSLGDSATNNNYIIKIKPVNYSTFISTTFETTGFTTVCNLSSYTHTSSGWQQINFTTPYLWDGTSNLLIELTHNGADDLYNSLTYYTAKTNSSLVTQSNSAIVTGTINEKRLNIKLAMDFGTVTWSPITNLYTNAAGTVPYQANSNAATVYVRSVTPGTTNYTALVTNHSGCSVSFTTDVTTVNPQTPTGDATQIFNEGATVSNLVATGNDIVWYATPQNAYSGTSPLALTTQLVDGQTYYAVSRTGGCSSEIFAVLVQINLGIDNPEIKNLSYYPNPVQSNLEIVNTHTITKVEVYTLLGQRVMLQNNSANQVSLNLEKFSAGTYLIKVFTNNASKDIKVIKK